MNEHRRISVQQLIATLQDVQAERYRYVSSEWVTRVCLHLEAIPTPIDVEHPVTEGCQHAHTVDTATLSNPGGKLCVDCNQAIP